jgi:hypothetical protein
MNALQMFCVNILRNGFHELRIDVYKICIYASVPLNGIEYMVYVYSWVIS